MLALALILPFKNYVLFISISPTPVERHLYLAGIEFQVGRGKSVVGVLNPGGRFRVPMARGNLTLVCPDWEPHESRLCPSVHSSDASSVFNTWRTCSERGWDDGELTFLPEGIHCYLCSARATRGEKGGWGDPTPKGGLWHRVKAQHRHQGQNGPHGPRSSSPILTYDFPTQSDPRF